VIPLSSRGELSCPLASRRTSLRSLIAGGL
jgi:hypothetical protein